MKAPPKRRPGRPAADPSGKQIPQSVRLTPDEIEHLRKMAGSVNAGVRRLVTTQSNQKELHTVCWMALQRLESLWSEETGPCEATERLRKFLKTIEGK